MDKTATLESRLALLRDATAARLPELAELDGRLAADLTATIVPDAPQIADRAPEVYLRAAGDDVPVRLTWLLDAGPVVICFYRGHWCPYSNVQLQGLEEVHEEIRSLGAEVFFIGPETRENALKMREKWSTEIPILYDINGTAMDTYHLAYEVPDYLRNDYAGLGFPDLNPATGWRLPIPASFVVDQLGVIQARHVDPDYTRRMEPADVLAALHRITRR